MVGSGALAVVRPTGVYLLDFFCSGIQFFCTVESLSLLYHHLYLDIYVFGDDAWIS